ncbi:hypothetical protein [Streptomyces sp. KLOTTS4A1]|uniref:hypothetical protein n=1 Tax=Streptomyces sp. KLOTTS4A1 TaxID=3390996 RepID=UPI0039F45DD0
MKSAKRKPTAGEKSPWPMACCALLLALVSAAVLNLPGQKASPPHTAARPSASPTAEATPSPGGEETAPPGGPSPAPGAVPARGEGRAADPAIQALLEGTWPRDLPPGTEQQLLPVGRAVLIADVTGIGRNEFPQLFDDGAAVVPAFSRVRVQAAIARRGSRPDTAVVHLVWAGADRGGTYSEGRIADVTFTRTEKKGEAAWTPQPS